MGADSLSKKEPDLSVLYLESLDQKERKAYEIAKEHLGMSFTLEKSVGFLKWKARYISELIVHV